MFGLRLRGITLRLSLAVFLSISVILAAAFLYGYNVMKALLMKKIEESALHLTTKTANQVELVVSRAEKVAENLADVMSATRPSITEIEKLVHDVVLSNPEIYGSVVAFEPFAFDPKRRYFAPYYYRNRNELGRLSMRLLGEDAGTYDYLTQTWYTTPRAELRPSWSQPYFDEGGGDVLMTTYSVPFFRPNAQGERVFGGVVTADLSLAWLQDLVDSIKIANSGYAFIIDRRGVMITHPNPNEVLKNSALRLVEKDEENPSLAKIVKQMTKGQIGFEKCNDPIGRQESWIAFGPILSTQWSVGVIFPEREIFADLSRLNREVIGIFFLGGIVLLLVIFLVARSITKPILTLAEGANEIASGRLNNPIPIPETKDEVAKLAQAFEHMRTSLQDYIRNLAETTAAKERIQSELQIAHDIQMSIVPKIFPPFPNRQEFDLHAVIHPAKEVGGDFYDFGLLPDDRLYFTIGDVSDKGVPASLFMAVIATLLKVTSQELLTPSGVLSKINKQLVHDNDTCMFATIFYGVLDIRTGELAYSSGGHNPPAHMKRNGSVVMLQRTKGMAVALEENAVFESGSTRLEPGDTLFLYTDGITEAMNLRDELYGEDRLVDFLTAHQNESPPQLIRDCLDNLAIHVGAAPQSDDITVMAIRFHGIAGEKASLSSADL